MNLSIILFLVDILGFVLNRKNINLTIAMSIAIVGVEPAIGLGILVAYYRLRGNISLRQ